MENVLIWPKEYPLLVKGPIEQNGAFILDALDAWPACRSTRRRRWCMYYCATAHLLFNVVNLSPSSRLKNAFFNIFVNMMKLPKNIQMQRKVITLKTSMHMKA